MGNSQENTNSLDYLLPDFMKTPSWNRLKQAFQKAEEELYEACIEHDIQPNEVYRINCIADADGLNIWYFVLGDLFLSEVKTPVEDLYTFPNNKIANSIILPIRYQLKERLEKPRIKSDYNQFIEDKTNKYQNFIKNFSRTDESLYPDRYRDDYKPFIEDTSLPNLIIQHIPNFVEGVEPQIEYFNTTEELLDISWIKYHKNEQGFFRFSISPNIIMDSKNRIRNKYYHLMLEKDNGNWWRVLGSIKHIKGIDLTEWKWNGKQAQRA
jgi:hypothetical protein